MLRVITKGWDHLIVLHYEEKLVNKVQNGIRMLWDQLGDMPNQKERAVLHINLRSWDELK